MKSYVCGVCGYVYSEAEGAEALGVAPGTVWDDVPEDFVCPMCGASKDMFSEA
jgi:rubredoxin